MPSRRSHTKSHHGCLQCKARRVKCDETTPQCQRCVRRQMECSYLDTSSMSLSASTSHEHLEPPTSSGGIRISFQSQPVTGAPTPVSMVDHAASPMSPPTQVEKKTPSLLDLELIHYYSTRTYMTMTSKLTAHVVWRDTIFQEALRHNFLLNALMATAAFHKALSHSEASEIYSEYKKVAFVYQNAALSGYIPALNNPSKSNAVALFALSALLSIWMFATKKLPEALNGVKLTQSPRSVPRQMPLSGDSGTSDFIEILTLIQGIQTVVGQTFHWLEGEIDVILQPPPEDELPPNPPDIEASFALLEEAIKAVLARQSTTIPADDRRELYYERLNTLRRVSRARTVLEWDSFVFTWPVMAESRYIELIRQRDPMSIALFVHWAACFKCLDHMWWAKGWSFKLVRDASSMLDESWSEVLQWPLKEVGLAFQDGVP